MTYRAFSVECEAALYIWDASHPFFALCGFEYLSALFTLKFDGVKDSEFHVGPLFMAFVTVEVIERDYLGFYSVASVRFGMGVIETQAFPHYGLTAFITMSIDIILHG